MIPAVHSHTFPHYAEPLVAPCDRVSQINLVATAIIGVVLLTILPWIIAIPANILLFSGYMVTHFPSTYDWTGRTVEPYFPQVTPFIGGFQRFYHTVPTFVDRHFLVRGGDNHAYVHARAPVGTGERTHFTRAVVPHPMSAPAPAYRGAGGERAFVGRR